MLKVGDKVVVRKDLIGNKRYGRDIFVESAMGKFKGKIVTIRDIDNEGKYFIEDGEHWRYTEEMFEKEDNKIKKLTFREVIANIEEGEIWESKTSYIGKRKGVIDIWDNKPYNTVKSIFDDTLFKLKRKQYTFQEAFECFEEGKEIESTYGTKYKFDKTTEEVTITETQYANRTSIYCFEDTLFRCDEIQGKWYINE